MKYDMLTWKHMKKLPVVSVMCAIAGISGWRFYKNGGGRDEGEK